MPVKQVSFDRPVTRQEVERLQAMAKAMRERPKQQVGHPLQAAANFANDAASGITDFIANRREQKRREALIGALQGKTLPGLDPEMFASMMNNDPDQAQQMYINAQIAAEQARREQAAQAAQWQRQQDAELAKSERERQGKREDYLWERQQERPQPMANEDLAQWGIQPQPNQRYVMGENGPVLYGQPDYRPLTPEERQSYGISMDAPGVMTEDGPKILGGGNTNVNVNTGEGESAFEKEGAKAQVDLYKTLWQQGQEAKNSVSDVTQLRQNLANIPGGIGTGFKSLASSYGIKLGDNASDIEAAKALIAKLVPAQRPPGSGQMSDRDIALFQESLPALMNTPEGNAIILDTMEAMARYKVQVGAMASEALMGSADRNQIMKSIMAMPDPMQAFKQWKEASGNPEQPGLSMPEAGDVQDGFEFMGGDPSNPENWRKVQ